MMPKTNASLALLSVSTLLLLVLEVLMCAAYRNVATPIRMRLSRSIPCQRTGSLFLIPPMKRDDDEEDEDVSATAASAANGNAETAGSLQLMASSSSSSSAYPRSTRPFSSAPLVTSRLPHKLANGRGTFLGFRSRQSLQQMSSSTTALMPDGGLSPCVIRVLGVGGGGCNAVCIGIRRRYI
jgi:hypothetical protein